MNEFGFIYQESPSATWKPLNLTPLHRHTLLSGGFPGYMPADCA